MYCMQYVIKSIYTYCWCYQNTHTKKPSTIISYLCSITWALLWNLSLHLQALQWGSDAHTHAPLGLSLQHLHTERHGGIFSAVTRELTLTLVCADKHMKTWHEVSEWSETSSGKCIVCFRISSWGRDEGCTKSTEFYVFNAFPLHFQQKHFLRCIIVWKFVIPLDFLLRYHCR